MDVMMPTTASERDRDLATRRPAAAVTSAHTLKIEAARAGVGAGEYQARLQHGLLWCYRCQDWHQADAFPADARRHSGRAGSCHQAIRAAARDALGKQRPVPPCRKQPHGSSGAPGRPRSCCPAGSGGHTGAGPAAAPRRAPTAPGHGHRHSTPTSPGSPAPARHATRSSPRSAGPARSRQAAAWYGWLKKPHAAAGLMRPCPGR